MTDKFTLRKIMLDTAPLIYYIEKNDKYFRLLKPLFTKIDSLTITAITSTVTLVEVLVFPKKEGNIELENQYLEILLNNFNLEIIPIDIPIAIKAAEIRALYDIKTPDAIQLATGIVNGCDTFLTNDYTLKRIKEISVLVINDL
jgi:predicted nucleic acid-binding protein